MQQATPSSRLGTTFTVAAILLGLIGAVQVILLSQNPRPWVQQAALVQEEAPFEAIDIAAMEEALLALPKGTPSVSVNPADDRHVEATEAALAETALAEVAAANAEKQLVAALPKPTPLPVQRENTPEARVIALVNIARALRDRGDTSTSLTRLREAQAIFPSHPLIISEMAITYEKMELSDKAIEQWRRIYEMGEQSGIYYAAAEAKMRALKIPLDRPTFQVPAGMDETAWENPSKNDPALPPGSFQSLLLGKVGTTDDTGNSQPLRKLALQVPIVARPNHIINVEDVVIQVFFYDQMDADGSLVETNADVSYRWSPRVGPNGEADVDWSTSEPEVLLATYAQVEDDLRNPAEKRNYFGYIVRVYYKNELNATFADPVRLLGHFPPPQNLETSDLPQ